MSINVMSQKKSSRRNFLGYAATAIVVGVIAGVGGYYAGLVGATPVEVTSTTTVTTTKAAPGGTATTTITHSPVTTTITQPPITTTTTVTATLKPTDREKLIEAAKNEGMVTLYTMSPVTYIEKWLEAFAEEHPYLKTDYHRAPSPQLYSRIDTERMAGKDTADVFHVGATSMPAYIKQGWIKKYDSPEAAAYPESLKHPESYGTSARLHTQAIIYNTDNVSADDITSWEDLLNPKWRGKIGLMDPRNPGAGMSTLGGLLDKWGEEKWRDYLRRFKEQDIRYSTDPVGMNDLTAAGELWIVPCGFPSQVENVLKPKGAPIDWIKTIDLFTNMYPVVPYTYAPHPNAARLFVDWMLSEAGQKVTQEIGYQPSRQGFAPEWVVKYNVQDKFYFPGYLWDLEKIEALGGLIKEALFES